MKPTTAADRDSTAIARVTLDPQALIQAAIDKGSNIETLERLVALAKDVQTVRARQAWYEAMAEFQRACPKIRKTGTAKITTRAGGSYGYTYAPLEEVMSTILPVMGPLGLSVSYRVRHEADRVIAVCRVSHDMGHHEESGEVSMPVVQDSMGANAAQRVGIASTYAKRYALLAIIGLAPEDDGDAETGPRNTVTMPRRESAPQQTEVAKPEVLAPEQNAWQGKIKSVHEKSGTTNGKKWILFTVIGADGMEFGTFSENDARFARETGPADEVRVVWEQTAKGGRKIVIIEPAELEHGGDA